MKMNFPFLFLGLMAIIPSQASSLTTDNNEKKT